MAEQHDSSEPVGSAPTERDESALTDCPVCNGTEHDLIRVAEQQGYARGITEGRRQATEGWAREWGTRYPEGDVLKPLPEADARLYAARHAGTVVSRLVGPWEPAEQPDHDVEVTQLDSGRWSVRCRCGTVSVCANEELARAKAAEHQPVEQPEPAHDPNSPAAKLRSLWAQPHGSSCICRACEQSEDGAHMQAMEERMEHEAEGGTR